MKERLTRNLDLKILAIVFAIILWLIVVNIDDPVKSNTFSGIEVQILNAEELEKQGLCYDVLDNTNIVSVTVSGRRSVIEEINRENIIATADMKDLSSMNTLTVKVTSNKSAGDLDTIKANENNVRLNIEPLSKVTKRLVVETNGIPAENYVLGSRTLGLTQVEVSGPESIVNTIETAKVTVDVDNASSTVSASSRIILCDKSGAKVDTQRLTLSNTSVSITQEILYSKAVDINYQFSGRPEEGYAMTGDVLADRTSVLIQGRKSLVESINAINVRGEELSVEGESSNKTVEVDLDDYLPPTVELSEKNFDGKVSVTAIIRRETHLDVVTNTINIKIVGLDAGKKAEIVDDGTYVKDAEFKVRLFGLATFLNEVDEDRLPVTLDLATYKDNNNLKELANGYYNIVPTIELPDGVRQDENCRIHIRITDK